MSLFRIYVDGALFYHPQMSKLAITAARIEEDAENIDSMTLSAPYNHPYLSAIRPLASTIVCKKGNAIVFEGRALDNGTDFYNTHTWTCESCLAYLKDTKSCFLVRGFARRRSARSRRCPRRSMPVTLRARQCEAALPTTQKDRAKGGLPLALKFSRSPQAVHEAVHGGRVDVAADDAIAVDEQLREHRV